jgi:hypothetical protein
MMMSIAQGRDYCSEPVAMVAKSNEQTQQACINRQQHQTNPTIQASPILQRNIRIISTEQQHGAEN